MSDTPNPSRQGRGMKLAVAGAAVLVVAAGAAFYYASTLRRPLAGGEAVRVVIKADRCEPADLTVPAGKTTFEVVNGSDRVVEWEILDGVMVLEERENIAPGLSSRLTARLSPGTFAITCGLLNNPRGTLTVTPSAMSREDEKKAATTAFLGAVAEYQAYLTLEAGDFAAAAGDLSDAIRAGDREKAQAAYTAARTSYLHVAPVAQRFSDLDTAIDAPAAYFAAREQDPKFGGFHRIALGLHGGGLDGLQPVADRLAADAQKLGERLQALTLAPDALATGAARSLTRAADRAAGDDAGESAAEASADFSAEIAGAAKTVSLLAPMVRQAEPKLADETEAALKAASADAARLGSSQDPKAARAALAGQLRALADDLSKFNGVLGLE